MQKTILILANSIRNDPNRCIAGMRARYDAKAHSWSFGKWIRPVSKKLEGEISPIESKCDDRTQPRVLDLVTIPLSEKADVPYQPENYFLDKGIWQKKERFAGDLSDLVETPADLWKEPGVQTDRVSEQYLSTLEDMQSLYLISPQRLYFEIETMEYNGVRRKHRRAHFNYNRQHYNLPITDPTMDIRYFDPFPKVSEASKKIVPDKKSDFLLVVSLGAKFKVDGNHYKLIATVIES